MKDKSSDIAILDGEPRYKPAIHNGYRPDDIITAGLVFYAPLYRYKGSKFKSVDPYQHLFTKTGALWRPDGLWFDGIADVINCGSPGILDTAFGGDTTGAYTYMWWQKRAASDSTARGILVKGVDPAFWGMWQVNPNLQFEIKVVGTTNDLYLNWATFWEAADANKFVHYALVGTGRAAANWNLYKNLNLLAKTILLNTLSGNVNNLDADIYAPGRAWGASGYFLGTIGEIMVYNRALTAAERQHNYLVTRWRYV